MFEGRGWGATFTKRGTKKTRFPNTQSNAVWNTLWGDAAEDALRGA
jgi:hypothetical protein